MNQFDMQQFQRLAGLPPRDDQPSDVAEVLSQGSEEIHAYLEKRCTKKVKKGEKVVAEAGGYRLDFPQRMQQGDRVAPAFFVHGSFHEAVGYRANVGYRDGWGRIVRSKQLRGLSLEDFANPEKLFSWMNGTKPKPQEQTERWAHALVTAPSTMEEHIQDRAEVKGRGEIDPHFAYLMGLRKGERFTPYSHDVRRQMAEDGSNLKDRVEIEVAYRLPGDVGTMTALDHAGIGSEVYRQIQNLVRESVVGGPFGLAVDSVTIDKGGLLVVEIDARAPGEARHEQLLTAARTAMDRILTIVASRHPSYAFAIFGNTGQRPKAAMATVEADWRPNAKLYEANEGDIEEAQGIFSSLAYHKPGSNAVYRYKVGRYDELYFYPVQQLKNGGWKGVKVVQYGDERNPRKAVMANASKSELGRYKAVSNADLPKKVAAKLRAHSKVTLESLEEATETSDMDAWMQHCVAGVGAKHSKEDAFAICTSQGQKSGYYEPGSRTLTAKGKTAVRSKAASKDDAARKRAYKKVIGHEDVYIGSYEDYILEVFSPPRSVDPWMMHVVAAMTAKGGDFRKAFFTARKMGEKKGYYKAGTMRLTDKGKRIARDKLLAPNNDARKKAYFAAQAAWKKKKHEEVEGITEELAPSYKELIDLMKKHRGAYEKAAEKITGFKGAKAKLVGRQSRGIHKASGSIKITFPGEKAFITVKFVPKSRDSDEMDAQVNWAVNKLMGSSSRRWYAIPLADVSKPAQFMSDQFMKKWK